ncbi:MAG: hypothetical protein ACR65U_03200 [Methylocystis sp.]
MNASLNFVAIMFAVITFISAEYKANFSEESTANIIYRALIGATVITVASGFLAFMALIALRSNSFYSIKPLVWAFGALIVAATIGIPIFVFVLIP